MRWYNVGKNTNLAKLLETAPIRIRFFALHVVLVRFLRSGNKLFDRSKSSRAGAASLAHKKDSKLPPTQTENTRSLGTQPNQTLWLGLILNRSILR